RRHTRCLSDWSSDVCSSDLISNMLFGWTMPRLATSTRTHQTTHRSSSPLWKFITCELSRLKHDILRFSVSRAGRCREKTQKVMRSEERRVGKGGGCGEEKDA